MIEGLVLLLVFQLLGNVAEMYFHLPVPGSVLGMFLLLVALIANDRLASWVRPISLVLISYLAVLFVPAGVGIMLHIDRLKNEALPDRRLFGRQYDSDDRCDCPSDQVLDDLAQKRKERKEARHE